MPQADKKSIEKPWLKKCLGIAAILTAITFAILYYGHSSFYKVPEARLDLNTTYPEMPEDCFHHYINLPIDHNQLSKGFFRGFYLLSPNFFNSRNITFLFTDGQMELVNTRTDFHFFEKVLRGGSYVLIGVRGHSPTLLPEAYKDGKVDYASALKLYSSDQQVEDIEQVRLDLIKKGILKKTDKINIFGASGAGILAQQYISRYGNNVNRVILESTGAPDLAIKLGLKYSPDFSDFNPEAAKGLETLLQQGDSELPALCNVLYQAGRTDKSPKAAQQKIVEELLQGGSLWKYQLKPMNNLCLLNYMIKSPGEIASRIRWFELVGHGLINYNSKRGINLLFELSASAMSDLLDYHRANNIPPRSFLIERNSFSGEVLILKGTEDVVFSDEINQKIKESYANSRLLLFKDGHRMQNDTEKYISIRNAFFNNGFNAEIFKQLNN